MTSDPWATANGNGYSLDKFYTGTSGNNTSVSIGNVRVPASILAEVQGLISSGVVPEVHSVQELLRDGLVHRMKYLCEQRRLAKLVKTINVFTELAEIERMKARREASEAVIGHYTNEMAVANSKEDVYTMRELLLTATLATEQLLEPYRGQLLKLVERYGKEGQR